jgi:Invasion associated locus B (IalB) protein
MPNPRIAVVLFSCVLALPAAAQTQKPQAAQPAQTQKPGAAQTAQAASGPKSIGKFEDWTAATYQESGQTVCYAFVRAQSSSPSVSGRGQVILTVTQRPNSRDAVAIEAGYTFPANAAMTVQVDQTGLDFYTAQRNAFARDGKAAVAAFQKGARAIARGPGPRDAQVTDTFSLKGFTLAYAAVNKFCPAR